MPAPDESLVVLGLNRESKACRMTCASGKQPAGDELPEDRGIRRPLPRPAYKQKVAVQRTATFYPTLFSEVGRLEPVYSVNSSGSAAPYPTRRGPRRATLPWFRRPEPLHCLGRRASTRKDHTRQLSPLQAAIFGLPISSERFSVGVSQTSGIAVSRVTWCRS